MDIFDFEELVADCKTILMVTHDLDLAERATRTILLVDGEIMDGAGSSAEIETMRAEVEATKTNQQDLSGAANA